MVAAAAIVAWAWVGSLNRQIVAKQQKVDPQVQATLDTPPPTHQPGSPFWMVLMGSDIRAKELQARSDTLIMAYVDPQKKRVVMLSIPRDTRVHIPGHGTQKINAAANWGPSLTIETLKQFTGVKIQHYMEVDFKGFQDLVNAIGGVWVNVPHRINDAEASPYQATKVVEKGYQKLDGAHALTFVRSRHFATGDLARVKDQQIFLKALAKQTMQLSNIVRLPAIVDAIMRSTTTDMNVAQLLGLANDMRGMSETDFETVTMPGTPKYIGGLSYVISDDQALAEIIRKIEAGEPVENHPSQTALAAANLKPADVTVSVRNGAGKKGYAAQGSDILTKVGFVIKQVGNTAQPVYDKTLIIFKTNDAKATLVHDALGMGQVVQSKSMYSFTTDVLVVIGKDWTTNPNVSQPAN
jgi:LCP family protein required for cell wall assembly